MSAVKETELKKFGLLLAVLFPALFGILLPLAKGRSLHYWPWFVAAVLGSLSLFFPAGLRPLHRLWLGIGQVLGWINTRILLSLLFFLIFTPLGWLRRCFKKKATTEYRVPSRMTSREEMERPY